MARDIYAYRDVAVESCIRDNEVRICPVPGQAYSPALIAYCPKVMTDLETHPLGTFFLVSAKLTDRQGGMPYLYVYHGDPVKVLTPEQAKKFLAEFKRGRI